jgi:hypothetical protein
MTTEQILFRPLDAQPSRTGVMVVALIAASVMAASFIFGRSAMEATARANAIAIAAEDQTFCAGLGFSSESEAHHKCIAGLSVIRRNHEQRVSDQATDLL